MANTSWTNCLNCVNIGGLFVVYYIVIGFISISIRIISIVISIYYY